MWILFFFIYKAQFSAYLHNDDKVSTVYIDLHQLLMLNNKKSKLRFIFLKFCIHQKLLLILSRKNVWNFKYINLKVKIDDDDDNEDYLQLKSYL